MFSPSVASDSQAGARSLVYGSLAALALAFGASGQERSCAGRVAGDLGITQTRCRGDACVIARVPDGRHGDGSDRFTWVYSVEPEVAVVRPGSPTDGVIRPGDRVVAIDDVPITTREGSRRFQHVAPGELVRLSYRRGGRVRDVELEAVPMCEDELTAVGFPGRDAWPRLTGTGDSPTSVDERLAQLGEHPGGVEGAPSATPDHPATSDRAPTATPAVGRPTTTATPGVHLGLTFECSRCAIHTTADSLRWAFTQPPRVLDVEPGGPADRAGLRRGDLLSGIDGFDIASRRGGEAFGQLRPGTPFVVLVVRPGGRLEELTVVPEDRPPEGSPTRAGGAASDPPESDPLRFSGLLAGALVEIRGSPVHIEELRDEGVVTIHAGANVIRIRSARED